MQLYGILLQYTVDFAFDWRWLRPFRRRMQEWLWRVPVPAEPLAPQVKARLLLQDLGPTFIKLGQIASTRPDLLPPDVIAELQKLQDDVPPVPFEEIRIVVETSLGYFIGPLVTVAIAVLVLKEQLRPLQWVALAMTGRCCS